MSELRVNPFVRPACLVLVLALASCASGSQREVRERLDEPSGVTWLADARPIVYARTETRYSRSERDYVFLGPVETNRQGRRDYYLWVGVGTTLDRGYIAPESAAPTALHADVRGEPMTLELMPWSAREPQLGGVTAYRTTVPLSTELAARVTLEQLALLADEQPAAIRVAGADGRAVVYYRWDRERPWPRFFSAAERTR